MKHLIFFIVANFLFALSYSQTSIVYSYDERGNRIARNVISMRSENIITDADSLNTNLSENIEEEELEFASNGNKVLIYPNPTKGEITLKLASYEQTSGEANIYDINGKLLDTRNIESDKTTFNISSYPNGSYILKLNVNNIINEWIIVKD